VIDVQPGKRFNFSSITVKADPTVPPNLINDNLALKVGEPIVAERVQGAEAKVAIALPENGYPFATVGQRDILLDQATGQGDYTLPIEVGPRARFGGFATEGDLAFDAEHVETLARFKRDELYDSRKVDDLRKALVATSLFSTVSAEPQRTGQPAADGTEYVTMLVKQDAGPPRTIAGSAGYAAGQGFTLEGTWTHRNMFPPEGALIVHGVAGTQEQGAGVTFRRANAGRRDRTFEVVAEGLRSDYDAYNAITGRLAARVSYDSTQIWQKRVTYAYGVELLGTAEKAYDFDRGERRRRTYYVAALNGQIGLDTSDDLLNPTKGFRLTALLQPEGSLGGGFNPYLRARIDGSAYYPFGESFVLAGRVRFGTIQGAARDDIAPSRRLYSGGGGSVRGFGYQKLGPLDPNGDPIGGRSLNEGAIEGRYRFGNFGVVAFLDAGQSYESTTPKFSDIRYGVGIGGRFYTNFGPMRLDVATPLGRRPGEARINVYVSIGQAF
jgi:translocation and assembly module TamA